MSWRLARSLETLRAQLDAAYPNRDRSSDGTIGDPSHASTASDHNPNSLGVVCAYDMDTDLDGTNDSQSPLMDALVERIRLDPHPDLKYLIYRGRIFSAYSHPPYAPYQWRTYVGADPHNTHAHVSVGVGPDGHSLPPYDDTDPWPVIPEEDDDMTDAQFQQMMAELKAQSSKLDILITGINGTEKEPASVRNTLNDIANGKHVIPVRNQ